MYNHIILYTYKAVDVIRAVTAAKASETTIIYKTTATLAQLHYAS